MAAHRHATAIMQICRQIAHAQSPTISYPMQTQKQTRTTFLTPKNSAFLPVCAVEFNNYSFRLRLEFQRCYQVLRKLDTHTHAQLCCNMKTHHANISATACFRAFHPSRKRPFLACNFRFSSSSSAAWLFIDSDLRYPARDVCVSKLSNSTSVFVCVRFH